MTCLCDSPVTPRDRLVLDPGERDLQTPVTLVGLPSPDQFVRATWSPYPCVGEPHGSLSCPACDAAVPAGCSGVSRSGPGCVVLMACPRCDVWHVAGFGLDGPIWVRVTEVCLVRDPRTEFGAKFAAANADALVEIERRRGFLAFVAAA